MTLLFVLVMILAAIWFFKKATGERLYWTQTQLGPDTSTEEEDDAPGSSFVPDVDPGEAPSSYSHPDERSPTSKASQSNMTGEKPEDLREEFKPGDFEKLYPKLLESNVQADHDRAARLIMFYGDLLLKDMLKKNGQITVDDVRVLQTFYKEHAMRHPQLLTNYAFVHELLERSFEVDDYETASAVFETLQHSHPEEVEKDFPCVLAKVDLSSVNSNPGVIKDLIDSCSDPKQTQFLIIEYVSKLAKRQGAKVANAEYRRYRKKYPDLPTSLHFPEDGKND